MKNPKQMNQIELEKTLTRVKKLKEKLESKQFLLQQEVNKRLDQIAKSYGYSWRKPYG